MPLRFGSTALVLATTAASLLLASECSTSLAFDLIVRGGTLVDGTGAAPRRADIGVVGDRVTVVGDLTSQRARDEVDASGLVVAPGFIDTQGQSGRALLLDGGADSHLRQGITSEIIGEASTPALWRADSADLDILRDRGVAFDWAGFSGFLDKIGAGRPAINLGSLVPLNQVRANVVGLDNRPPTPDEAARMRGLVDEAMRQGAFGLSGALIYPPGSFASTDEVIDLARVVAPYGAPYVSHIRGETDRLPVALDEAIAIGREAGVPVVVFHLKVASRARWGSMPAVVDTIDRARAAGVDVSATQYPYTVAGTSLDACLPDWVLEGGTSAALRRLRDPLVQRRVRRDIERGHDGWENFLKSAGFDGVTIASVPPEADGSVVGLTLEAIARARGHEPWQTFFELLIEHRLRVSALYALMHEDDVRVAMRQPWVSFGSDSAAQTDAPGQSGRPHPRGFGTFPRVLGHYVRETAVLTLPDAVHRMTGFAARQFGIADRGEVRVGAFADLVVFDAATIADRATFDDPRQYPVGIDAVIVNGVTTMRRGVPTGARAGRGLRRADAGGPAASIADSRGTS